MLNQIQVIPYQLELRDTLDAALYHFANLESAAAEAITAQDVARAAGALSKDIAQRQPTAQRRVFDHLDAFLGSFARISLLIFPVSSSPFGQSRAATMQVCLAVAEGSTIADRELRDSWVHHDERLDFAVQHETGAAGQTFTRSAEVPEAKLAAFLRVIELDTLVIHYRSRQGEHSRADLRVVHSELIAIEKRRETAFDELPMPDAV